MIKPNKIKTVKEAREYAESCLRDGVCMIIRGLNACESEEINYRYGLKEQERLKELIIELMRLVDSGNIELLAIQKAKKDKDFQRFLKTTIKY